MGVATRGEILTPGMVHARVSESVCMYLGVCSVSLHVCAYLVFVRESATMCIYMWLCVCICECGCMPAYNYVFLRICLSPYLLPSCFGVRICCQGAQTCHVAMSRHVGTF